MVVIPVARHTIRTSVPLVGDQVRSRGTKSAAVRPREPVEAAGATPGTLWLVAEAGQGLSGPESSLAAESVAAS